VPLALLPAACGDSGGSAGGPVTVTVTPTVTASPKDAPKQTSSAAPALPKSDVVGRGYDFGTVTGLRAVAGTQVLTLDRWTW
jgi:hypothetical protein